jgi:hypothetical protein
MDARFGLTQIEAQFGLIQIEAQFGLIQIEAQFGLIQIAGNKKEKSSYGGHTYLFFVLLNYKK